MQVLQLAFRGSIVIIESKLNQLGITITGPEENVDKVVNLLLACHEVGAIQLKNLSVTITPKLTTPVGRKGLFEITNKHLMNNIENLTGSEEK